MSGDTAIVLEIAPHRTEKKLLSLATINRLYYGVPKTIRGLFAFATAMLLLYVMLTLFAAPLLSFFEQQVTTESMLSTLKRRNQLHQAQRQPLNVLSVVRKAAASFDTEKKSLPAYFPGPQNERQQAVVNSFLHAWKGYKAFAWGEDELNPVANTSIPWFNMQLTLIESLDTLLIMGLKQEFQEAREEIAANFTADVDKYFSFFEVTIRVLGGLLSAFYLSKDELFLQKARMLGDRLLPAFSTRSGFPLAEINPHLGTGKSYFWTSFVSLAELGTSQLEFRSLSRAVGNPAYEDAAFRVSLKLHEMSNMSIYPGLMPADIYEQEWVVSRYNFATYSVGARADSYYEYLLKQWLQTGKRINWLRDDFVAGMQAVLYYLARPSKDNRMLFLGEYKGRMYKPRMEHLTCFAAGSLALAAYNGLGQRFLRDAERIAAACRFMYAMTPTGLGPEFIRFGNDSNSMRRVGSPVYSLLRPEAVEAWFYLYRVTNDTKYQDWGWQMLQAIENHAKTPSGYCSIVDVYQVPTQCKPKMESFLLSETFKYLYLLFDDSHSLLPLKEYVFNTEAHPLPVF